jgi:hypothetical protein
MFEAGGDNIAEDATLTFDDSAASFVPEEYRPGPISGTYKPSSPYGVTKLDPPAPALPYGSRLEVFAGQDPNGPWQLYVQDMYTYKDGSIDGGWSLELREFVAPTPRFLPPYLANGRLVLTVPTVVDGAYTVESRPALGDAAWAPIESFTGDGSPHRVTDPIQAAPEKYYRVRSP